MELQVEGNIPAYAVGTLFRTGLGIRDFKTDLGNTYKVNHWFDNLSHVHRFEIHPPETEDGKVRVTYNSRATSDGLIANIKKTGNRDGFTFGAKYDPCMSIFQKFSSMFKPRRLAEKPSDLSCSVTLSVNFPGLSSTGEKTSKPHENGTVTTLCNKTDSEMFQMLDPETLEPIGMASQKVLHPSLKGPLSATHAQTDPITGDVYNFNLAFASRGAIYRIFHVSTSTAKTSILATFSSDAAYIHSSFLTKNYFILCVWNSLYSQGGTSLLWNKNIVDSMSPYDSSRRCKWYLIDRQPGGKGIVAVYDSDPFFSFHTVNAYEQPSPSNDGSVDIVADIITYPDLDVLKRMYIDNLLSSSPTAEKWAKAESCQANLRRFILPSIPAAGKRNLPSIRERNAVFLKAISEYTSPKTLAPELPTISPLFSTRKHRYIYGVVHSGKSTLFESIVKFDCETKTGIYWEKHGHTAGEPIFVPRPRGKTEGEEGGELDEDDGVLMSVVLDGPGGKSYLLVLDARNLKEVGRAHVNGIIGFGFHGTFVGK